MIANEEKQFVITCTTSSLHMPWTGIDPYLKVH